MILQKLLFLACVNLLIGFAAISGIPQSTPEITTTRPETVRNVFADALLGQDKPGGFVIVKNDCGSEKPDAPLKQPIGASEDLFDFITKTNPDYRIVKGLETINLLPADYEPEILKVRINDFFIDSDKSISVVLEELLSLKELRGNVNAVTLNKGMQIMVGSSGPSLPGPRRVKHLSFVQVRQALNDIAVFYRNGIWAYTEYRCDGKVKSTLSFVKG